MKVWRRNGENGDKYKIVPFFHWSRMTPHPPRRRKRKESNHRRV